MIATRSLPQILGVLAVAQAVLAVVTWWPADPSAHRLRPLLELERDAIKEIRISGKPVGGEQAASVELVREANGWVLRSSAGYPAAPDRVEVLLDQLLALEVGNPIASQSSSHNPLQVGSEEHGRRLEVATDSERITLLLGAATSKSVNVRFADEPDVYRAAGVSEWSFRDVDSSYYDPVYVDADPAELDAVSVSNAHGALRFEKQGEDWTLAGLSGTEVPDSAKIEALLKQLTKVRMVEPVGTELQTGYGLDGRLRVDWTAMLENQSLAGGYKVGADVEANSYVKAVDHPFVVTARSGGFDALRDAKRADFLQPAAEPPE